VAKTESSQETTEVISDVPAVVTPQPAKMSRHKVQAAKMMFETLAEGAPVPGLRSIPSAVRVPSPVTQEIEVIPAGELVGAAIEETTAEFSESSAVYDSDDEIVHRSGFSASEDDDIVLPSAERGRNRQYRDDFDDNNSDIVLNSSPPKFDFDASPMLPSPRPIDFDYNPVTPIKGESYLNASSPAIDDSDYDEFDAPPLAPPPAAPVRSRPSTARELPSILEAQTPRSMQEEWGSRASAFLAPGPKKLEASPLANKTKSLVEEDGPGYGRGKFKLRGPNPIRRPLFTRNKQAGSEVRFHSIHMHHYMLTWSTVGRRLAKAP
jgi:hypothetical protein